MKKKEMKLLKQRVDGYVKDLNASINIAVSKFFVQMSDVLEENIKENSLILPCTVSFPELVSIVEKTFSKEEIDKPSENNDFLHKIIALGYFFMIKYQ